MKLRLAFCASIAALSVFATERPDPGELEKYIKDGSYAKRAEFVKEVGNHRVRPDVAQRMLSRLRQASAQPGDSMEAPLPSHQGMPTKGTNKMLVFLIDFPDYAHVNDASLISNKLFGDGIASEFPKESLRNYYRRSSYNQLEIQGAVLGWHTMQHARSWYTTTYPNENDANRAIILEVVQAFDATHDFAQYDNDGDGEVDYFAVIWAGQDNGWGNFWWGYQWSLQNPVTADGVSFRTFSWQWESRPVGTAFQASTIIHETGHALGLPDYYDYDSSVGPGGGVGGLDMMDGNYADHNAFSKFMLEWLTPKVVPAGTSNLVLRALAGNPDAVTVMPNMAANAPYSEYFLVENRYRTNNDVSNPGNGVLIWHVDATPNDRGEDFLYDNSYTAHKLLRLMEADGLEEIENGDGRADAGDYWNQGEVFGSGSMPNSRAYDGSETGVMADSFSADANSMSLQVAVEGLAAGPRIQRSPESLVQTALQDTDPAGQTVRIWATGGSLSYAISDDATWLSVSPGSGSSSGEAVISTVSYSVAGLAPGTYMGTITVTAPGATNSPQTIGVTLAVMGNNIGRAVDAENLTWSAGGGSFWFEQNSVTYDGQDAVQSGTIGNNQTNWIQTSVEGPGLLSFWWKVSSEAGYDFLRFYVDGVESAQKISGATEWQRISLVISGGQHSLRWAYSKDTSVASGADAGWVDQVEFVPGDVPPTIVCPASLSQVAAVGQDAPSQSLQIQNGGGGVMSYTVAPDVSWLTVSPGSETSYGAPNTHTVAYTTAALALGTHTANITITAPNATNSPKVVQVTLNVVQAGASLADAVDYPAGTWTSGGSAQWIPSVVVSHDGQDSAASPDITHDQVTWMGTTVQGPGMLSFWWKVSSEANYDYLDFLLDGQLTGISIDGEVDWRQETVAIPEGAHVVRWAYSKDSSADAGSDMGWLDEVVFTTGGPMPQTILSTDFSSGLPAGWTVLDNYYTGAIWRFDNPCAFSNATGGSGAFAIADSDCAGEVWMDTDMVTPVMDLSGYTNVVLEFKSDLMICTTEKADVDVRVNGSAWVNVWRRTVDDYGPKTYRIHLPQADNQPSLEARFHYYNAYYDYLWCVDDVNVTAISTTPVPRDYVAEWRQAWDNFDQNYSRFLQKGIDWGSVYYAQTNLFASVSDAAGFADQLNTVLQSLNDWQVSVKKPDGTWLGYGGTVTNNCPAQPFTGYTGGAGYSNLNGANAIYHAWTAQTISHVIVTTLEDAPWSAITDADLDALFQTYRGAEGLILDLRANTGGNVTNALRIASRFSDLPRVYGYTRTRTAGSDHGAFGPFASRLLEPATGVHFTNKVACLTGQNTAGAGEWLALMMKSCPQATLIGDRTRGSAGNVETFSQSAIGVDYAIPREIVYNSDQVSFEDTGIAPQVAMAPGESSYDDAQQRDFVLERAIAWLRRPTLVAHPVQTAGGVVVQWPGGVGSTYTLLRSTNLLSGPWLLAPGSSSNRAGSGAIMSYTNNSAAPQQFYRIQVGP